MLSVKHFFFQFNKPELLNPRPSFIIIFCWICQFVLSPWVGSTKPFLMSEHFVISFFVWSLSCFCSWTLFCILFFLFLFFFSKQFYCIDIFCLSFFHCYLLNGFLCLTFSLSLIGKKDIDEANEKMETNQYHESLIEICYINAL